VTPPNRRKAIPKELDKAEHALASAELLLAAGQIDAALNRAYYCAFHAARAALLTLGVQPRTHQGVNQRFNLDLVVPGHVEAEYLSILGRVQTQRELADYGVDTELGPPEAANEIAAARRFLRRIEALLREGRWIDVP
jgi:hypothetical protein